MPVASGAVTAKSGASFACQSWPLCEGWDVPDLADPLVRLHFGHRLLALATAALVTLLYVAARLRRFDTVRFHRDARLAFRLFLLEVVAGAVVVLTGVPLWGAVAHQAIGTLVFGSLAFTFLRDGCSPDASRAGMLTLCAKGSPPPGSQTWSATRLWPWCGGFLDGL